ncbi:MAG: beta-hydroxyacyl-ACP dehydratase [Puniceicoccales bacterium]|jgi:3-hydroxyacyl-[acyl-carrier-protein] dehydratase|nr:beta-hydroxyacyl-ACP dehydratase [Puniceicoccales bacterium]
MINIKSLIPHREPFLFVDSILSIDEKKITAHKMFSKEEHFYEGHYPNNPITPGVILCETIFQTAAALILKNFPLEKGTPVLAKIEEARFKSIVKSEELLKITAELEEKYNKFFLMNGTIQKVDGTTVLKIKFSLAISESELPQEGLPRGSAP